MSTTSMECRVGSLSPPKECSVDGSLTALGDEPSMDMVMGGMTSNDMSKSQRKNKKKRELRAKIRARMSMTRSSRALIDGIARDSVKIHSIDRDTAKAQDRKENRRQGREKRRQRREQRKALWKHMMEEEEKAKALLADGVPKTAVDETSQVSVMEGSIVSDITALLAKRHRQEANEAKAASANGLSTASGDNVSPNSAMSGMTKSGISKVPKGKQKKQKAKAPSQDGVMSGMAGNGITKAHRKTLKTKARRDRARAEKRLLADFIVPDGPQEISKTPGRSITAESKADRIRFRQRNKWDPDKLFAEIEKLSLDPKVSAPEYD